MFDLKVMNAELDSSTCQVSWCVDQETLKFLSDNNIVDPQVVIVVSPEGRRYHSSKEYRKVVSMKDLVTWVELRCAGPNKIWGFISQQKPGQAKDEYLSRRSGDYKTDILNYDGSDYQYDFKEIPLLVSTPQSVVVPADAFATEPAAWEKTWVYWLVRDKAVDQCDFRRHRLFAYTLQPMIMALNLMYRLFFVMLGLLIGARDFTFDHLIHPMSSSLEDSMDVVKGGSIFIRHVKEDDIYLWKPNPFQMISYIARSYWSLPFMPVIFIVIVLATLGHVWGLLLTMLGISVVVTVMLSIIAGFISNYYSDTWDKFMRLIGTEDGTPWYLDQKEIDLLTCDSGKKPLNYKSLPARKKTLYLRFQNLKAKVCKPYSA